MFDKGLTKFKFVYALKAMSNMAPEDNKTSLIHFKNSGQEY